MPTKKGTKQPARTRDETMEGNLAVRLQVRRTLAHVWFADRAKAVVAAGIRRGDIVPRPGSAEWLAIISEGLESGLIRKPNGKVKR